MTAAFLRDFMPYGAPDLQEAERPHLVRALLLGCLLASLLFAIAWALSLMHVTKSIVIDVPPIVVHDNQRVNVLQPPPLSFDPIVQEATITRSEKIAIPVPVPDAAAPMEETIASPSEVTPIFGGESRRVGIEPLVQVPSDGPVNREGETAIVDELPVPVREVEPPYPDMARQAHVEGLVVVNVLVGKDGRVVEARLHPIVNIVLLNDASLEAARKWVFTPAIDHGRPVAVWVTLPFHYRLY